jgi:hypothetical protein
VTALRRLNDKGIAAFRDHLRSIRAGSEFQQNPALLYVDGYSTPILPRIEIAPKKFASKYAAAAYLATVLRPLDSPALSDDAGLWSWLALYYFDQLSPVGSDGKRRPREDYHYIPSADSGKSSGSSRGHQRHLLAGPYRLHAMHGERARVLLHPAVHQHGRFVYDLGYRRDFLMNRGLVEAVDLLYWNPKTKRPRRGAGSDGPGALRRLIAVLQQLEINYDLFGMTASEILDLLPEEFDSWKPQDLFAAVRV